MIRGRLSGYPGRRRPFVEAQITIPSLSISGKIELLLDTGADSTLLGPMAALRLGIDVASLPRDIPTIGVGGTTPTVWVEATLTMDSHTLPIRLRILAPQIGQQQRALGAIPSLLGRDVLSRFALFLEERTNRVLLFDPQEVELLRLPQ